MQQFIVKKTTKNGQMLLEDIVTKFKTYISKLTPLRLKKLKIIVRHVIFTLANSSFVYYTIKIYFYCKKTAIAL